MYKKVISFSLASILFVGCAHNPFPTEPILTKNTKLENKFHKVESRIDNKKPIDVIKVDKFVYKTDYINHDIPSNIKLKFNFSKGMTLLDFSKKIGFPSIVEDSISQREICFNGTIQGNVRKVLDTVASLTNVYWTYDNGVVKFMRTKNIVYTFPFFSMERLQAIYNTGPNSNDPTNVQLKKDIFDELQKGLEISLDTVVFSGEVSEEWNQKRNYKKNRGDLNSRETNLISDNQIIEDFASSDSLSSNKKENDKGIKLNENIVATPKKKKKGNSMLSSGVNIRNKSNKESLNLNETTLMTKNGKKKKDTSNTKHNNAYKKTKNEQDNFEKNKVKSLKFKTVYGDTKSKISISKEMGIVFARLTPNEEKRATNIIKSIIKKRFSSLIVVDTFILTVNEEKLKDYSAEFSALIQNGLVKTNLNLGSSGLSAGRDSLSLTNSSSGSIVSGLLNYFVGNSSGKVVSEPTILTMPNIPARIKDTKFYPYVEPEQITGAAGNSVSYKINNVEEGIDLTVLPTVLSDNTIMLSIGLGINQYLGEKTVQAGIAGTFNLPQQAPKKINTTFRIKPGDIIVLGGIKNSLKTSNVGSQLKFFPSKNFKQEANNEFLIIAVPRLIKFVEKGSK